MYADSAYWHNHFFAVKDRKHPLFVTSAGTYHLFERNCLPTNRPRGRLDWQLLYVASGKGHFYFNGVENVVDSGCMVLYRPRESQRYYYYGKDRTEVFWVHFTGNDVTNILRRYGIADDCHVIRTGASLEYRRLFQLMIREIKLARADYEEYLAYCLRTLFIMIHRRMLAGPSMVSSMMTDRMEAAVSYFHENYASDIGIEEYAVRNNMSVSWFIRNFRDYTKFTPAKYILSLRVMNAQNLLKTTDYTISEIASIVGYDNPLYFSRVFRASVGISPTEFRMRNNPEEIEDEDI